MNIERINEMIKETGKTATPIFVCKYGVEKKGLSVKSKESKVGTIVYFNDLDKDEDIVSRIMSLDENYIDDMNLAIGLILNDPQYVFANSIVCLQQKNGERFDRKIVGKTDRIIKRLLLNQEIYIRLLLDKAGVKDANIKVTSGFLDMLGLDPEELWEHAIDNTRKSIQYFPMENVINKICTEYDGSNDVPMYILTNKDTRFGASALLYPEVFQNLCKEAGWNGCLILPSSIHELIALPEDLQIEVSEGTKMVEEINDNCVDIEEQLTPSVYRYQISTNAITVA